MAIIKATDFEKIQHNELTLDELKRKHRQEEQYVQTQFQIKERLIEADQSAASSVYEENKLLEDKLQLMQSRFKLAEKEIQRLNQEIAKDAAVKNLQDTLFVREELLSKQNTALHENLTKIQTQDTLINMLEGELGQAKGFLQKLQTESLDLKQKAGKATAIEADLRRQVQSHIATIELQTDTLTQTKDLLRKAQAEVLELKQKAEKVAELETELRRQTQKYTDELQQMKNLLQETRQENTLIKRTAETTAARDSELERQINTIKETNSLAAKENLALRTSLQKAEQQIKDMENTVATLQTNLQKEKEKLTAQEQKEQAVIVRQTSEQKKPDPQIKDLENTISKLQKENTELAKSQEHAVQEMNRVIGSFSAEQDKNIQLEYKFKRAEQEFRDLQNELKTTKEALASFEKEFCIPEKFLG